MIFAIEVHHPLRRNIWLTYALVGLNALALLVPLVMENHPEVVRRFGFIPADPRPDAFFISMFLHAGFFHFLGNNFFLWMFGDNLEDRLGWIFFAGIYLFCGVFATIAHWITHMDSIIPVVGASGAISGLMGFYAFKFPNAKMKVYLRVIPVGTHSAWNFMLAWIGIQVVFAVLLRNGGVAYAAHAGGALSGIILAWALKESGWIRVWPKAGAKEPAKKKGPTKRQKSLLR